MASKAKTTIAERRRRNMFSTLEQGLQCKFKTRVRNRCGQCGRPRGYMRFFHLCRICFRNLADSGMLPGVRKSSW